MIDREPDDNDPSSDDEMEPPRLSERRDPNDRRWGSERRRIERRVYRNREQPERRTMVRREDDRRRLEERRIRDDRRTVSLPSFPQPHRDHIIAAVRQTGRAGACPVCSTDMTLGPLGTHEGQFGREVRCPTCRNGAFIENLT